MRYPLGSSLIPVARIKSSNSLVGSFPAEQWVRWKGRVERAFACVRAGSDEPGLPKTALA